MPMIRAMRMLNAIEGGTLSGAQLQTLLEDPARLGEWNVLLGMRGQARRMAASSVTMTAVIASSTAMNAVAASSTAMNAVAASSTAMTAVANSKTALLACWKSETALTALRSAPMALTALLASPHKQTIGGTAPSALTSTLVDGKTILLQSRNAGGSDTNTLVTKFQNGVTAANHIYTTTTTNTTQMIAFQDIKHTNWQNNYIWYGDVVKVD